MKKQGLSIIHSNRMEQLRDLCFAWLAANPLSQPLAKEVILTHSQGMQQWLELEFARHSPAQIYAALDFQLPLGFLWQMYRRVLGEDAVPRFSAFDRADLIWHLYRHLPACLEAQQDFAALQNFIQQSDDPRRLYQLAVKLADLFDQYQVYRADWLQAWSQGQAVLFDAKGQRHAMPDAQIWQFLLWQVLTQKLGEENHRAAIHPKFLQALAKNDFPADILPERIVVFGISSLPAQMIEALAALARHVHVLILLHNPCAFFWGDLQEDRALIRRAMRQQQRTNRPEHIDFGDLHLYSQPLLASFGRQGRDFIALLDEYDQPETYRTDFAKIDLFDLEAPAADGKILHHLQYEIATLEALPPEPEARVAADNSIMIHVAHSRLREVEILHDQLLALFANEDLNLKAHEVMVMMPNIAVYSPFIAAVFGARGQIPFTIADQSERDDVPLLRLIDTLLDLPEKRCTIGEVLDWLRLDALAQKFGLTQDALQTLSPWLIDVGIRWGFDGEHRAALDLPDNAQNTWLYGIERMLLGYASGRGGAWHEIEPFADVSGLEVEDLGRLIEVIAMLRHYVDIFAKPASPALWYTQILQFLDDAFLPQSPQEWQCIERIQQTLEVWLARCERAGLQDCAMSLAVVREVLNEAFQSSMSAAHFLGGAVNFAMMMPMRAIPFKVICILGLNDQDFPRRNRQDDMDLTRQFYRAGDRAKRDEDRYLFLEAILSARAHLYLSYVGQDIHSNEQRPPSVVLAQCCDYLDARWCLANGEKISSAITQFHPLQAFSPKYFAPDSPFFSYAREWESAFVPQTFAEQQALAPISGGQKWNIASATQFLRQACATFFRERLQIVFHRDDFLEEDEPFTLSFLGRHQLQQSLLDTAPLLAFHLGDAQEKNAIWQDIFARLQRRGQLPHGAAAEVFSQELKQDFANIARTQATLLAHFPQALSAEPLHWRAADDVIWHDLATNVRQSPADKIAFCQILLGRVITKNQDDSIKAVALHRLLEPWVRHVLAAAAGKSLPTWLFISEDDEILKWPPMSSTLAQHILQAWHDAHQIALCAPLPVAIKTASAWLLARDDEAQAYKAAAKTFNDDGFILGERAQSPYLARAFVDFDDLAARGFAHWAQLLYAPLLDWTRDSLCSH